MEDTEETKVPTNTNMEIKPPEPKEPTRFNLFMRKMLRWSTGVLSIFVLGIILTWVVQVSPRVKELREVETQLESANQEIEQLQTNLDALQQVESENIALQDNFEAHQNHLTLLSILVDVNNAQLALVAGNLDTAQAALAETDSKISALIESLGASELESLQAMQERLALAIAEMSGDSFVAQSDLDVLGNSILALERSLFGD
ncbi:MAG: hypothetical protein N2C13_03510 [Chloroflexota bacterium]